MSTWQAFSESSIEEILATYAEEGGEKDEGAVGSRMQFSQARRLTYLDLPVP